MRIPKSFNAAQPAVAPRPGVRAAHQGRAHRARRGTASSAPRPPTTARSPGCARDPRAHPCHGCDEREDHARWAERYHRLQRDTRQLERRIEGRTNTIARTFDRIVALLTELDYLRGRRGHRRRAGGWPGSTASWTCWPASACATASGRGSARPNWPPASRRWSTRRAQADDAVAPKLPSGRGQGRAGRDGAHLGPARRPGGGASRSTRRRGSASASPTSASPGPPTCGPPGTGLDEVLREAEMPAGDFVRWCKQVIDVLGQIAAAAPARRRHGGEERAQGRGRGAARRRGVQLGGLTAGEATAGWPRAADSRLWPLVCALPVRFSCSSSATPAQTAPSTTASPPTMTLLRMTPMSGLGPTTHVDTMSQAPSARWPGHPGPPLGHGGEAECQYGYRDADDEVVASPGGLARGEVKHPRRDGAVQTEQEHRSSASS